MMHKRNNGQDGFASITVALIMVLVLALITIGFAQLARREQGSSLDRQLATQAYYAAEAGINDVIDATTKFPTLALSDSSCSANQPILTPKGYSYTLNGLAGISYSCVLVDKAPSSLLYSPDAGASFNSVFTTSAPLTSLTISWGTPDKKTYPPNTNGGFDTENNWSTSKQPAVLQISLTPTNALDRDSLINNTFTVYAYPSTDGGTVSFGSAKAQIIGGGCNDADPDYSCKLKIDGLNGDSYVMHVTSNYDKSQVKIEGKNNTTPVDFNDAQMTIDVTGKAKDVLKRLQVRRCLGVNCKPDYPMEAQNICKRPQVVPDDSSKYIDENGVDVSDGIPGAGRNIGCALDKND